MGYGSFYVPGIGQVYAHCLAWELANGPMPGNREPDHTCDNPGCVNAAQLELKTHRKNVLRGTSAAALNAKKTHCPVGHEYTSANTVMDGGNRRSRVCRTERARASWARRKRGTGDATGEQSGSAKLRWAKVEQIRGLAGTKSQVAIAAQFGMSSGQVSRIIRGEYWRGTKANG